VRASHFRSKSKTVSIPKYLGYNVTGELVVADVAFLTFREKSSAALGFLSGVIAFCGLLFHD
jgi:hypothetical protein